MPRKVMMRRRLPDGTMSAEKEVEMATEKEIYEGKERRAIIDALNVLGCYYSLVKGLPKGSKEYYRLIGQDYELGEAYMILYGALGIDLDLNNPRPSYEEYDKLRYEAWHETKDD